MTYLPLNKKNIVITRSKDKISDVKNMFTKKGARIFDLPALIIDYPDDLNTLDNILLNINKFNWIIFSSSNGVNYLEKRLIDNGSSLRYFSGKIKFAVVGNKTSESLNSLGIQADFIPPNFVAESLLENFPFSQTKERILLPRVQSGGRNIIAEKLRNMGAIVDEVATYESRCPTIIPKETEKALKDGIVDAIIFSSGKTVFNSAYLLEKYFGDQWLSIIENIHLFTIGPQTSIACQKLFKRVNKQADIYTFEGLLEAIISYFN
tara:strand:- start:2185 stop:2976 length:792 start_codon:yes stop_codon:yes gene_type:complete